MATKITTRVLADDAVTDAKIADVTLTTATQSASDNTTKIATTAYVTTAIANLADSAPSTLNTLNELAAALGDDANYATTTTNAIAAKLPLAGGNITGNLGIGQSSPSAPLDLVTSSNVYAAEFTQSNTSNGDGVLIMVGSTAAADYALTVRSDAGNTSVLAAKADGKVGIGNFTPGNSHAKANMLVVGSGSAGGMALYNGANAGGYYFARDNANNTDAYDGGMAYDGSRNLTFHTNAGTERMRITGSGLSLIHI